MGPIEADCSVTFSESSFQERDESSKPWSLVTPILVAECSTFFVEIVVLVLDVRDSTFNGFMDGEGRSTDDKDRC